MKILICLLLLINFAEAQTRKQKVPSNPKVIYKYKTNEKFDFEDIAIEGDSSSPGDLSIEPRVSQEFKNKLPNRRNFNDRIIEELESLK